MATTRKTHLQPQRGMTGPYCPKPTMARLRGHTVVEAPFAVFKNLPAEQQCSRCSSSELFSRLLEQQAI